MTTKKIVKSYGTIMNDGKHKYVTYKASQFKKKEKAKDDTLIPEIFNPFNAWGTLIDSIQTQGECGGCWAMASASALTDRYSLMTLGQFKGQFSPYEMIACQGAIVLDDEERDSSYIDKINNQAHTQGACNGNTLYNAMDFMYYFGLTTDRCVNVNNFSNYGIMQLTDIDSSGTGLPLCQSIIGTSYDTCLDKETAARFYRICAGYSVEPNIESIKREIYKWGPVVGCFNIFPDFLEYDGISIYEGPKIWSKHDILGGHAVKILGWGKEKGVDYWWIANSWGVKWGLSGYFRMKINIEACKLENNIVAFIPDLVGFDKKYLLYEVKPNKHHYLRDLFAVDKKNGYRKESIKKINNIILKGDPANLICPHQPDFKNMWVGKITGDNINLNYLEISQWHQDKKDSNLGFWYFLSFLFCMYLSYWIGIIIAKRKK